MPKARPAGLPQSLSVPLSLHQVKYDWNDKGEKKLNIKNSPIPLPHPHLVFKKYEFSKDGKQVFAYFETWAPKGTPGSRSKRPSGGANREFFNHGFYQCKTDEDTERYMRNYQHLYIPLQHRRGPQDQMTFEF